MAHVPPFSESPETPTAELLALQACDDVDSLRVAHRAFACLEKLIVPQRVNDAEEVYPSRTELSALVSVVNDDLQRRIEVADASVLALRAAVDKGAAAAA